MNKKLLGIGFLATAMLLNGCAANTTETETATQGTYNIVTTSFHEYDWLMQVIGEEADNFNVTLLLDDGVDLHSYEPTVEDIASITTSDLFIYNGGESDAWVDDILAMDTELNTVNVMEALGENVQMTVLVEGMEETEHDHDHDESEEATEETTEEDHDHDESEEATEEDHDHDESEEATEEDHDHDESEEATEEDHDHDESEEATEEDHDHDEEDEEEDEHIWLSLANASIVCEHFADVLSALDSANEATYEANAQAYISTLDELDAAYETMVAESARDTILVADRFPYLYLMSDYGINYYAAFDGCSAETEASFETVVFLAEKADEYDVNYLIILDNGLAELASTIATNSSDASRETLELNSMQSVTQDDIDAGVTYYSIMEENLEILRLALAE